MLRQAVLAIHILNVLRAHIPRHPGTLASQIAGANIATLSQESERMQSAEHMLYVSNK